MKKLIPTLFHVLFCLLLSAACRVDTVYKYSFDPSLTIKVLSTRQVNRYNAQNKLQEQQLQTWAKSTQTWTDNYTEFYSYDAQNNITQIVRRKYNTVSGQWLNLALIIFQYDNANNRLEDLYHKWNDSSSSWVNEYRYRKSYNSFNKITDYMEQRWSTSTNEWLNEYHVLSSFDANGNLTENIVQNPDNTQLQWVNAIKYIYHYDTNQVNTDNYTYTWSTSSSSPRYWYIIGISSFTYNANQSLVEKLRVTTNQDSTVLQNYSRDSYVYDANEMCVEKKIDLWRNSSWLKYSKVTYEYDANLDTFALDVYSNTSGALNYDSRTRTEHICTGFTNSIDALKEDVFEMYPNPNVTNVLVLNTQSKTRFFLIDINGRQLQTGVLKKGENTIPLNGLSSGIYMMKIGEQTKRLMIQ